MSWRDIVWIHFIFLLQKAVHLLRLMFWAPDYCQIYQPDSAVEGFDELSESKRWLAEMCHRVAASASRKLSSTK
ncbi:hypothetical protein K0038_00615 [Pseudomonas syringae]|nr:hypothetical protein [Pseudomonas syringae]